MKIHTTSISTFVAASAAAVFILVATLNTRLPEDEHLAVALNIQDALPWYRDSNISRLLLKDEKSPDWCDLHLLKKNGSEDETVPKAKLIYLLQIHEAYAAGLFKAIDTELLQKLINIGIARCDLDHQLNPPSEFKELLGTHRALVYATMSRDETVYRKLIEHGASTNFTVQSESGNTTSFEKFRESFLKR